MFFFTMFSMKIIEICQNKLALYAKNSKYAFICIIKYANMQKPLPSNDLTDYCPVSVILFLLVVTPNHPMHSTSLHQHLRTSQRVLSLSSFISQPSTFLKKKKKTIFHANQRKQPTNRTELKHSIVKIGCVIWEDALSASTKFHVSTSRNGCDARRVSPRVRRGCKNYRLKRDLSPCTLDTFYVFVCDTKKVHPRKPQEAAPKGKGS